MKWLAIISIIMLALNAVSVLAMEHAALSNIFTLDTRDLPPTWRMPYQHSVLSNIFTLDTRDAPVIGGLEHSAVSNVFTLDTRDSAIMLRLVSLSPDPNPQVSQVMEGGTAYRHYRVLDSAGGGVSGVAPVMEVKGKHVTGGISGDSGLLKVAINTQGIAQSGESLPVKVVKLGGPGTASG